MANQSAPDLQQIHDFTANYFFWQGLRWVPLGLALLLLALGAGNWLPFGSANELVASLVLMAAALAASSAIGRWYRRRFGRVRGRPELHTRRDAMKWFVVYPLLVLAMVADGLWEPPILVSGAAWGVALLAFWWSTGRGRSHYVALSAAMMASTFLPLFAGELTRSQRLNFIVALIGGVYVVVGVLDHLALLRMMNAAGDNDDRAV